MESNNIPLIIYTCAYRLSDFEILASNLNDCLQTVMPLLKRDFGIDRMDITWLICKDTRTAFGDFGKTFELLDKYGINYRYYERCSRSDTHHNFDEQQISYGLMEFIKDKGEDYNPYFYMWDDDNLLNPQMFYSYIYTINQDNCKDIINFKMITERGESEHSSKYDFLWWSKIFNDNCILSSDPSKNMIRLSIIKKYCFFSNLFEMFNDNDTFMKLATRNLRRNIFNQTADTFSIIDKINYFAYDFLWYGPVIQIEYNLNNVTFVDRCTSIDTYHNGLLPNKDFEEYKKSVEEHKPIQSHLYLNIIGDNNDKRRNVIPIEQKLIERIYPIIYDYYKDKYNF